MNAPKRTHNIQYRFSFYFPEEYEPDPEQIEQIIRALDEQHPWDAGTNNRGEKLPSIGDIEYEEDTPEITFIPKDGTRVQARIHSFLVTPSDSPMPWERALMYNAEYVFKIGDGQADLIQRFSGLPPETLEVKTYIGISHV